MTGSAPRRCTRPTLTIDLDAVAANTRKFAAIAPEVMAVVKADGFGHGAADVARTALANGASWLGVTSVAEAVELRAAGIDAPTLSWLNPAHASYDEAVRCRIDLAAPGRAHLVAIATAARRARTRANVHLHADVGMARDGAEPEAWGELCAAARVLERNGLVQVVGVMGHLGWADRPDDPANVDGLRRFHFFVDTAHRAGLRPSVRHLAATAATLTMPDARLDLCRIGAGLVGIDPSSTTRLRPALTLTAPVVSVRSVARGTSVGYGHTYTTSEATRLALLPVGYADGLPRFASGRASALIRGQRRRVAGLISMDQTVVDLGPAADGHDPVDVGDEAVLFGPGGSGEPTTAEWASWAETIEHEIVTGVGARIARDVSPAARPLRRVATRPAALASLA